MSFRYTYRIVDSTISMLKPTLLCHLGPSGRWRDWKACRSSWTQLGAGVQVPAPPGWLPLLRRWALPSLPQALRWRWWPPATESPALPQFPQAGQSAQRTHGGEPCGDYSKENTRANPQRLHLWSTTSLESRLRPRFSMGNMRSLTRDVIYSTVLCLVLYSNQDI